MSDTTSLDNPRLLVVMADGTEHDVQTDSPDLAFFDLERSRQKWPTIQEGPFIWLHYIAYSKLRRTGALTNGGGKPPAFLDWMGTVSKVINLDADGNPVKAPAAAFPTQEGAAPDSSLR